MTSTTAEQRRKLSFVPRQQRSIWDKHAIENAMCLRPFAAALNVSPTVHLPVHSMRFSFNCPPSADQHPTRTNLYFGLPLKVR